MKLSIPTIIFSLSPDIAHKMPLKRLTPDRHLQLIKWILHNIVTIQFINPSHNYIDIGLLRLRKKQELRPRKSLKATESER